MATSGSTVKANISGLYTYIRNSLSSGTGQQPEDIFCSSSIHLGNTYGSGNTSHSGTTEIKDNIILRPQSLTIINNENAECQTKNDEKASILRESARLKLNSVDWRVYVQTRAEERGVALLKKNGVVIVVGRPGSGKTTLALSIMKQIENEEKRESYLLTHYSEFNDISLSRNKKCVVLIDDIFGKTNLISDFIESWKLKFPVIQKHVQEGSIKCIITLRKKLYSETKISLKEFGLFNEKHVLDLQSDDCCLDFDEKEEILNKYLKQKDVPMDETDKMIVIYSSCIELGFPQVCVYYVNNTSDAQKRGVEFFKKPLEYLKEELENLKKDKSSKINYLVLLLIMFKQGSLSIDSLDPFENDSDSDIMKLVRLLEQNCLSLKNTDLTEIKETADVLCGTYLKCCDNEYTFIHQSVFDSVFLMFSSEFPKKAAELLEVCPVSMLLEYVDTPGVSNKSHITMTVRPDCFDFLARRFTDLLASDKFREIISHPSLKDEEFLKYLIEEKNCCGRLSEILRQRLRKHQNHYIYISSIDVGSLNEIFRDVLCVFDSDSKHDSEFMKLLKKFENLKRAKHIFRNISCRLDIGLEFDQRYMSYWHFKVNLINSSSVTSECIVNELRTLSRFFTLNLHKIKLRNPKKGLLEISCLFHNEDAVKMLLKSGVTPIFDTFCAAACSKTDSATILKELFQYKKDMKLNMCSQLLHISICSDNINIACLLADMINKEKNNSEIKEEAVKLLLVRFLREVRLISSYTGLVACARYLEKSESTKVVDVSRLFKKLVTIDIINKIKDIAIIAACQSTSGVIKEIVKLKPDCLNADNRDKVLLAAAMWGYTDTVNFLIEQRGNDTDKNNWKKGEVLKVAVMFNSADVVQCLLDKGADPNVNVYVNQKLTEYFEKKAKINPFKLLPSDTPLHISVLCGDLDMVKSLIERKADVNAVNSEGETPLHEAVEAETNKKEIALLLLKNGADINITDKQKNSALHIASQIDIDVVKEVTKRGVEINAINSEGKTPLFLSLHYGRPEITLYLLRQGADPNLTDNNNNSVLHLAAKHGNIEIMKKLIKKHLDPNIKNNEGKTPLFTAVMNEQNNVVLYLLEQGADPNLTDKDNNSVLHIAAKHGNIRIVRILIKKGVDVNIKNNNGKTPLLVVEDYHTHFSVLPGTVNSRETKVVLHLLEHGADPNLTDNNNNSVLHQAAKYVNIEIVKALIEKGVDVNIKTEYFFFGNTPLFTALNWCAYPVLQDSVVYFCQRDVVLYLLEHGADPKLDEILHIAARKKHIDIVKALIENNVDVNAKNSSNETPLMHVLKHGLSPVTVQSGMDPRMTEVACYLLDHGAYANVTDNHTFVLHRAAGCGSKEIVTALIEKDANVNVKNHRGETPLFTAVMARENKVALYLLEQEANPELTDNDNNSVLHIAAKYGNIEIVTALIENKVNVNLKNCEGETPLFTALNYYEYPVVNSYKNKVVLYLLKHGADPNLTNKFYNSVLHLAAEQGNIEIMTALIEKGVNVNSQNIRCETALFTAVKYTPNKIVLYLLAHGADPNLTDWDNNSVLHIAAKHGNIEIVTALIEKGVDIDFKNKSGQTPLLTVLNSYRHHFKHYQSADYYKKEVVLFLLEQGADPNLTDKDNNSALYLAAQCKDREIEKALSEKNV